MIDKAVFSAGMGQLGGAFGREIDGAVSAMYYSILSPHLTSEQFADAVTRACASETFWPAPAVILEKAGVSPDQRSEGALRMVNDALLAHGGYRYLPAEISQSWDAATWAAIREIGGLKEITDCTHERWAKMRARFRRAYEAALSPNAALPSGEKPDPRVKKLVADTTRELSMRPLSLVRGKDAAIPRGDR